MAGQDTSGWFDIPTGETPAVPEDPATKGWFDIPTEGAPGALSGVKSTPQHMPDTMNPMVPEGSWNGIVSMLHGMSLGAGIPASARWLAAREADTYRKAGADESFIAHQLPVWVKEASDGLTAERAKYAEGAPGTNLSAEILGSLPTSLAGTSAGMAAIGKTLTNMGLPWMARLVGGTLARGTAGVLGAAGRVASRATQGLTEGALSGTEQAGLNPDRSLGDQAKLGGGIGLATAAAMPALRPIVKAITGTIPRPLAEAAVIAERAGVPIAKNQLVDRPLPQIIGRAFGPPPVGQRAAIARARNNLDVDFNRAAGMAPGDDLPLLDDIYRRRLALNAVEGRINQVPNGTLRGMLHMAGPMGAGLAIGGGAAAGGELLSMVGHLADPRAWPLILGAAAVAKGARSVGHAAMNSQFRRISQRANALGMTTSEYLGVPNLAIPLANRTEEYSPHAGQ